MKRIIGIAIIFCAFMYACNSTKTPSANATEKTIAGINWNLKKIHSSSGVVVINNPNAFIKFDAEKNSAGGKGGCNSFGSNYNINNASINFKNVFSTKMFCEKFQKEEDEFFKQLEKVNRYDVVDGKLFLYQDNELLLEFDK